MTDGRAARDDRAASPSYVAAQVLRIGTAERHPGEPVPEAVEEGWDIEAHLRVGTLRLAEARESVEAPPAPEPTPAPPEPQWRRDTDQRRGRRR